jgi:hypothetical protein
MSLTLIKPLAITMLGAMLLARPGRASDAGDFFACNYLYPSSNCEANEPYNLVALCNVFCPDWQFAVCYEGGAFICYNAEI